VSVIVPVMLPLPEVCAARGRAQQEANRAVATTVRRRWKKVDDISSTGSCKVENGGFAGKKHE